METIGKDRVDGANRSLVNGDSANRHKEFLLHCAKERRVIGVDEVLTPRLLKLSTL